MATGIGTYLALGLAGAGAYWYYNKNKKESQPPPAPSTPSATTSPTTTYSGVTIPPDVSGQMQNIWASDGQPLSQSTWVNVMTTLYPLKQSVWNNVFLQWLVYYNINHQWPPNATMQSWIATAEANYG